MPPETPFVLVRSDRKAFVGPHSSTRAVASCIVVSPLISALTTSPSVLP